MVEAAQRTNSPRTITLSHVLTLACDAHGNRVFSVRRAPTAPTSTNGRYTANLGHVMDDESGLVYMRARYYEPSTGRFVSEDPARDGANWFVYCGNDPVNFIDNSGTSRSLAAIVGAALAGFLGYLGSLGVPSTPAAQALFCVLVSVAGELFGLNPKLGELALRGLSSMGQAFVRYAKAIEKMYDSLPPPGGIGMALILACAAYSGTLYAELFAQEFD